MSKPDRFKLEQAIYDADITRDLEITFERFCDGPIMSEDDGVNTVMALWQISKLRQWKLWDTYTREFELDNYRKMKEDVE